LEKFQSKYRIASNRYSNWDYSSHAAYFITINTKYRTPCFGEIIDGAMRLNALGEIVENEWQKTPIIRPDMNLELGTFVVMPDHFHGIIIVGENQYNTNSPNIRRDGMHAVSTNIGGQFGPQSKNLGSIIRGFKSAVTTNARKLGDIEFNWQERFHDRIIRDHEEFYGIEHYISDNPRKWFKTMFDQK
jgi:putative transposase